VEANGRTDGGAILDSQSWEAAVLPLNYTRMGGILTAEQFERQPLH